MSASDSKMAFCAVKNQLKLRRKQLHASIEKTGKLSASVSALEARLAELASEVPVDLHSPYRGAGRPRGSGS